VEPDPHRDEILNGFESPDDLWRYALDENDGLTFGWKDGKFYSASATETHGWLGRNNGLGEFRHEMGWDLLGRAVWVDGVPVVAFWDRVAPSGVRETIDELAATKIFSPNVGPRASAYHDWYVIMRGRWGMFDDIFGPDLLTSLAREDDKTTRDFELARQRHVASPDVKRAMGLTPRSTKVGPSLRDKQLALMSESVNLNLITDPDELYKIARNPAAQKLDPVTISGVTFAWLGEPEFQNVTVDGVEGDFLFDDLMVMHTDLACQKDVERDDLAALGRAAEISGRHQLAYVIAFWEDEDQVTVDRTIAQLHAQCHLPGEVDEWWVVLPSRADYYYKVFSKAPSPERAQATARAQQLHVASPEVKSAMGIKPSYQKTGPSLRDRQLAMTSEAVQRVLGNRSGSRTHAHRAAPDRTHGN
jgi:hypothetical protein